MSNFVSNLFKTHLSHFRAAILVNNTNRICRILDVKRHYISKQIDSTGNTALLFAIKYASPLTVELLLQQGAQPDQPNFATLQTPLSLLAPRTYDADQAYQAKLDLEMAILLLDHNAYVEKTSPFKRLEEVEKECIAYETPLMTAVRIRNLAMATLLVDREANVNYAQKHSRNRPVHYAIMNGDEAMFDLLEKAGASCRTVISDGGNTLLHWFCNTQDNDKQVGLLKKLLDAGCDVNATNDVEQTPLMVAAQLNMVNTCEVLLAAFADTEKVDNRGHRAIDLAKLGGDCFRLLLHVKQHRETKCRIQSRTERVLCKKQIASHRRISNKLSNDTYETPCSPSVISTCVYAKSEVPTILSSDDTYPCVENSTMRKRIWSKLLRTKQRLSRTKDSSSARTINDRLLTLCDA
ncbi:unnamed protein product [Adineta ricciae]|uniref:Uncharacterized protein n=1 Tax=Adineta ricciae TaxID=249248 RepID=A0A814GS34_ADIRI|nr:unnamed protein product [Adineta ricciae]